MERDPATVQSLTLSKLVPSRCNTSQGGFSDRCRLLCSTIPNNSVCAMRRVTKLDFTNFSLTFSSLSFDTIEMDRNENNRQDSFKTIAVHANHSCKQKCFLFSGMHHKRK